MTDKTDQRSVDWTSRGLAIFGALVSVISLGVNFNSCANSGRSADAAQASASAAQATLALKEREIQVDLDAQFTLSPMGLKPSLIGRVVNRGGPVIIEQVTFMGTSKVSNSLLSAGDYDIAILRGKRGIPSSSTGASLPKELKPFVDGLPFECPLIDFNPTSMVVVTSGGITRTFLVPEILPSLRDFAMPQPVPKE